MKKNILISITYLYSQTVFAQKSIPPGVSGNDFWKVILGLLFVIGCILLLSFFVKKIHGIGLTNHSFFQVISGVSLGSKERLLLVKAGEEYLLIGVSPGRVNKVHDFGKTLNLPEKERKKFASVLQEKLAKSNS